MDAATTIESAAKLDLPVNPIRVDLSEEEDAVTNANSLTENERPRIPQYKRKTNKKRNAKVMGHHIINLMKRAGCLFDKPSLYYFRHNRMPLNLVTDVLRAAIIRDQLTLEILELSDSPTMPDAKTPNASIKALKVQLSILNEVYRWAQNFEAVVA